MRVIEGKSEFIAEIHGAWIHNKLNQVGVVVVKVGPDDGGLKLIEEYFHLRKDLLPCWKSCNTLADDVPDVFPGPGADPAVTRDRRVGGSSGTLCGQGAVGQVILTEHLDVDAELLYLIC